MHTTPRPASNDSIAILIKAEEIRAARPSLAISPGHDGLTAHQFRAISLGIIVRIFNLILWCENLFKHLAISRTTFIPKKSQASLPGEFRPIFISSVFARVLHKILAQRIDAKIEMDDQRAFRARMDGCRDNTVLLDVLLRSRYQQFKSTFAATLDLARSVGSVEHSAIMRATEAAGIPPLLIKYLKNLYASSTTTLMGTDWSSEPIKVTRKVKQGDPISPVICNLVIDQLLRSHPQECGSTYNGKRVRAMAFADDLVLLADSPIGLQHLHDWTSTFLGTCDLLLNTSKCHKVSIFDNGGLRKTVVDANWIFHIKGQPLRALSRKDSWKYLGIEFSLQRRRPVRLNNQLSPLLEQLTKAPLKPQQRIYAPKAGALSKVYYHMALGRINIGDIWRVD